MKRFPNVTIFFFLRRGHRQLFSKTPTDIQDGRNKVLVLRKPNNVHRQELFQSTFVWDLFKGLKKKIVNGL